MPTSMSMRHESSVKPLTQAIIFCIEYFLQFMVLPGRIENFNVIFNLKNFSFSKTSLKTLRAIFTTLSVQQPSRVHNFYVCHMPVLLRPFAALVLRGLTCRQRMKTVFVKNAAEYFHKEFALHQLEKSLGGSQSYEEFFPFNMPAGPFKAGYREGERSDAVARVHLVLTKFGSLGKTWDPNLSNDENKQLEYTTAAAEIFENCGLLLPRAAVQKSNYSIPSMASQHQQRSRQFEENLEMKRFTSDCSSLATDKSPTNTKPDGWVDSMMCWKSAKDKSAEPDIEEIGSPLTVIEDTAVKPFGFFRCRPIHCEVQLGKAVFHSALG